MPDKKIKVIKKEETEKRKQRAVRAEITLLEVYIERYPDRARKFIQKHESKTT